MTVSRLMRASLIRTPVLALAACAWASVAMAYQTVKVGPGGGTVFTSPRSDSPTAGTLNPGVVVNIGDQPNNGFYRCSAAGGVTGWISADDVVGARKTAAATPSRSTVRAHSHPSADSSEPSIYVGALGGVGIVSSTTALTFGAEGGYKFRPDLGVGVFFTYQTLASASSSSTSSTVTGSSSGSVSLMSFAGELNYFFQGALKGLHLGAMAGLGILSVSSSGTITTTSGITVNTASNSASTSGLIFGGGGGYDFPLGGGFSVGAEADVLLTTTSGSSTLIDALACVKYGF